MTTATSRYDQPEYGHRPRNWLGRTEDWMDSRGKWAWMTAMVLGFVFFWPVGLAILFYMIWGKKMFSNSCRNRMARRGPGAFRAGYSAMKPSGNRAFDSYKEETLRRLEEEQDAFEAFLERLRAAKDKAEFDQFMDERARRAAREREDTHAEPHDRADTEV